MALFIIYSDLVNDEKEWQETLKTITDDFKHKVCIVTRNAAATQLRLSSMKIKAECLETRKEPCCSIKINKARKLTQFTGHEVIIAAPASAISEELADKAQKNLIVIADLENKECFNHLQKLSRKYKHSNSKEFQEIRDLLQDVDRDLHTPWPIISKKSLAAQKMFLASVLIHANNYPHKTAAECLLAIKADFEEKKILADVVTMPVNIGILRIGIFKAVLNFNTATAELIQRAENRIAEKAAEQEEAKREAAGAEIEHLLSPTASKRYGTL
ncbi:MAG: hypothetical protein K0S27_403 [Gammaproteobacteria bacterium]|jgi:hypothetical protein|nr:hypothetical protein [Gammaproteobacteria bacterium]